jgi:hypothetical protein
MLDYVEALEIENQNLEYRNWLVKLEISKFVEKDARIAKMLQPDIIRAQPIQTYAQPSPVVSRRASVQKTRTALNSTR